MTNSISFSKKSVKMFTLDLYSCQKQYVACMHGTQRKWKSAVEFTRTIAC